MCVIARWPGSAAIGQTRASPSGRRKGQIAEERTSSYAAPLQTVESPRERHIQPSDLVGGDEEDRPGKCIW